jgi:hypothetical protein
VCNSFGVVIQERDHPAEELVIKSGIDRWTQPMGRETFIPTIHSIGVYTSLTNLWHLSRGSGG